jgi:RNA polymerase sigma-70 factor (ECF subfamily)
VIDPATEARLVARLREADDGARAAALNELFERLGRPLFQLCLRVTCDPTDAEDAVQETFVDVLRGLGGFRADARLATWIFRIAIRAATRVRSRRRRAPASLAGVDPDELRVAGAELHGAPDPGAVALERESVANLLAAMERLPAGQRVVLGLAALEELPQTEIAAILGIPVGTVYSRLSAARERMRKERARCVRG